MASFPVQFVGPSYQLANRKADAQRSINLYPQKVESGSGKAQFILKSVPGLSEVFNSTATNKTVMRGVFAPTSNTSRMYFVIGDTVYSYAGPANPLVALSGAIGGTGAVIGCVGRDHIVFADGTSAYYFEYAAATPATTIVSLVSTAPDWVCYLAGRFIYGNRYSDEFEWSAIDAPNTFDPLDFATAESSPDGIQRGIIFREELWLMGSNSTEIWRASSSADSAFERNSGISLTVGCAAPKATLVADNSLFFIGRDDNGTAVVYMASGYQPQRVSTHAIEQMLSSSSADIANATAYAYQLEGQVFYCINAGLTTTLCFDVTTGAWHERTELYNGDFAQHRITHHAIAHGLHYFCGSLSGHPTLSNRAVIYLHNFNSNKFGDDLICRERTSPHYATPSLNRVFYSRLRLDCSVGSEVDSTKYVQLYYSNDGGYSWTDTAQQRSLGETGDRRTMVQWNRLGSARDRVWRIRCTDDVAFDIVGVDVQAEEGTS